MSIKFIGKKEKLDEQLLTQDEVITSQQSQIETLLAAFYNKTKTKASPNIYIQGEEPLSKKGIWLQDDNLIYENIVADSDIVINPAWNSTKMALFSELPSYLYGISLASVGTNIYIFGGMSSTQKAYKINTLTNSISQLSNMPTNCLYGAAVSIGTDIYILMGNNSTNFYKFDTLTEEYTKLSDLPTTFYQSCATKVGTDIYYFTNSGLVKYDTLTGNFTTMRNRPYSASYSKCCSIGTDIYLFSGTGSSTIAAYAYKYNTLTDIYTKLTDIPYAAADCSVTSVGKNIYIFGGGSNSLQYNVYEYDTLNDTYTKLSNMSYNHNSGASCIINNGNVDIYIVGGDQTKKIQILTVPAKEYENNTIVISEASTRYSTELINTDVENGLSYKFDDVYHYTTQGGLNNSIPTYYGNGEEWIKFKN